MHATKPFGLGRSLAQTAKQPIDLREHLFGGARGG
jgi:hypothetical protein